MKFMPRYSLELAHYLFYCLEDAEIVGEVEFFCARERHDDVEAGDAEDGGFE